VLSEEQSLEIEKYQKTDEFKNKARLMKLEQRRRFRKRAKAYLVYFEERKLRLLKLIKDKNIQKVLVFLQGLLYDSYLTSKCALAALVLLQDLFKTTPALGGLYNLKQLRFNNVQAHRVLDFKC
jgi:hypothetical protein